MSHQVVIPLRTDYQTGSRVVGTPEKFDCLFDAERSINQTVLAGPNPQTVGWVIVNAYGFVAYYDKNGHECTREGLTALR